MWYNSILEIIGNTPMLRLTRIAPGIKPILLAKLEYLNPGGSVKDRIGITMIEDAERRGILKPGGTIIEGTSGNTGMGLVLVAAMKGYRCIFTMPDKMSQEKIDLLRAFGAEVIVTPTAVEPEDPRSYHSVAVRLSKEIPNSFFPNQYDNPSNPQAHYDTTGPEIWEQTEGKITHLVCGIGTGGTIVGAAKYLKEKNPYIRIVGVDPEGSIYAEYFATGRIPDSHPYKVEGIGQDSMPKIMDFSDIDQVITVSDKDSFLAARQLVKNEGIFAGGSAGSAIHAALKIAGTLREKDVVVVIIPDHGSRYLSKLFNDNWMKDNRYLEPRLKLTAGNVSEGKRAKHALVTVSTEATLMQAIDLMQENDISQLPVMENGKIIGSLTENKVLSTLVSNPELREQRVMEFIDKPFPVVSERASIENLYKTLDKETSAIIVERKDGSMDIITKSDLIYVITERSAENPEK
ncbi:MAG: cystathionine beta-synthase [Bacteroidetes bacterium]|jgi:cystathionine beta-synthase|nr:cystathionine beta-synthase [Bacteroidota bacterium]MCL5034347.1 cystathionine beta-synthase [Bacteroidota bacterium]